VARRTAQRKDLAKSLAKSLRKGRWPIFSTLSSVKPTLCTSRNLGAPTHQTDLLVDIGYSKLTIDILV
jgi:hypothetical protein